MSSVRRRLWPAARIACSRQGKDTCGEEGGTSQAYTLSPSQRLCVYVSACVRACQCVSAVQVRAYLKKHPRKSNGNGYANARNTHLKLRAFIRSAPHIFSKKHLNTDVKSNQGTRVMYMPPSDMKCVLNSLQSRTDYTQESKAKDKSNARNKHTHSHKHISWYSLHLRHACESVGRHLRDTLA